MKFMLICSLFLVGITFSQQAPVVDPNRTLLEALVKRGEALQTRVNNAHAHIGANYKHLLHELEYQTRLLDAIVANMKNQLAQPDRVFQDHHIHSLEENYLHIEHRVIEELNTIKEVGHNHQYSGETAAQIATRAEKLVKDAKSAMASFPKAKEIDDMNREIANIEALEKLIQTTANPTVDQLRKFDEELYGHEVTIKLLIDKATL